MPKISYSLAIAFGIHILIFFLGSTFSVDNKDNNGGSGGKNLINLNFGSDSGSSSTASKKIISKETHTTSSKGASSAQDLSTGNPGPNDSGTSEGSGNGSGSGSFSFEESALNFEVPVYPKIAIKRDIQGVVRIRVKVSPDGLPESTDILKSSGHEILDKAALDSATRWRFQKRGTSYFVEKNIVFELRG